MCYTWGIETACLTKSLLPTCCSLLGFPKISFNTLGNIPDYCTGLRHAKLCCPATTLPKAKIKHPTCAKVCKVDKYGACGISVVQFSLQRLIWSWQGTSAWGTHNRPAALYPAAALILLPQEGKHNTESRREGRDSACDDTQRKTDHCELFELEITEVILHSSTRERILYLVYTIC